MDLPPGYLVLYDLDAWSVVNDCDCACPAPLKLEPWTATPGRSLRRHPAIQALALDAEHTVMFVPSWSRVAVLNRAARAALDQFAEPRLPGTLDARESRFVSLVSALGLLTDGDGHIPPPPTPDTLVAWLHVTNACNLRCTYCYVDKSSQSMDAATGYAAIDAVLRSAHLHGYQRVLLKYAGGEATLNLSLVEELHRYALARAEPAGITVTGGVLSNGTALTRARIARIRDLGLRLMVSLDGLGSDHDRQRPMINGRGSWAAVCHGIDLARAAGLIPDISITITGQNIAGLPALLSWVLDRDLPFTLNFYRPIAPGRTLADLQYEEQQIIAGMRAAYQVIAAHLPRRSVLGALLDRTNLAVPHQRACAAGENYLVIDHQGQVARCQMELDRPVTTIAAPDPLAFIRADQIGGRTLPVDDKIGCRTCQWRYWCAGGCPVATFRATGRDDLRSPNCAIYTALYPDLLRLEGSRLLHWHLAVPGMSGQ